MNKFYFIKHNQNIVISTGNQHKNVHKVCHRTFSMLSLKRGVLPAHQGPWFGMGQHSAGLLDWHTGRLFIAIVNNVI